MSNKFKNKNKNKNKNKIINQHICKKRSIKIKHKLNINRTIFTYAFIDWWNLMAGFKQRIYKVNVINNTKYILDVEQFMKYISTIMQKKNNIDKCMVVGTSYNNSQRKIFSLACDKVNAQSKFCIRQDVGEVFADEALISHIQKVLLEEKISTIHICTGDGNLNNGCPNFFSTIENALQLGWTIKLWVWKESISNKYIKIKEIYKKIEIIYFDNFFSDKICHSLNMN